MSDLMQERLDRAERALTRAGFTYTEGAQEWKPPIGPSASPLLDRIDQLAAQLKDATAQCGVMAEPLREAISVISSINHGGEHEVHVEGDEPAFWQRGEWVEWARSDVLPKLQAALAGKLPERRDTEWTDASSTPTADDYRELQAQHDQLQSKHKAALDALSSAVKTAEFEGHAHRPWHDSAKTLLADNAPMPEPAPVVPDELDYDVELESGEYDHELDEPFLRGRVQGWNDCRSAMLAATPKPDGAA